MQAVNLWNKFSLLGCKRIILAGFIFFSSAKCNAQSYQWAKQNNPMQDTRKIGFGFVVGIHTTGYQVKYSDKFVTPKFDTLHSVMAPFSPGFSVGFLANLRLAENLDVRLMPKAAFYNHKLIYNFTNGTQKDILIETTMVELPLLFKYKSQRRGNVRMYMIGGINPGFELSSKKDDSAISSNLEIYSTNMSLDAGLGFDFYFPLFKFSQELRFSQGISNILGNAPGIYKDPISKLNTNTVSVYFIFQ
jgi:hypothetical protein